MRQRSRRPRAGQTAQNGALLQGGDAGRASGADASDPDPHAEHARAGCAGRAGRHRQCRNQESRQNSDLRFQDPRPSGAGRTARHPRHSARRQGGAGRILLLEGQRGDSGPVALLLGAAGAGRTRLHDVHDPLSGEGAHPLRHRLSAVLRRPDLQHRRGGSRSHRDFRADAGRLPRRRRARRSKTAALLHRLHPLFPHRSGQLRQGGAGDLPRAPVPQGRADHLLQAGGFAEIPRILSGERGVHPPAAGDPLPRGQRLRRRPRRSGLQEV